ncbi:MAG: hypothetical protein L0Y67_01435 [Gammaproteobacteria bacterium]|nr:hypothetical protein [Gammaproteobacteria bacterium]MCI0590265.1 hypothetical protein [Gammaproteobacteria bacterium]
MLTINPGEVNEIRDLVDFMRQQFFDAVLKASIQIKGQKLKPKTLDMTFADLQKKCDRCEVAEKALAVGEAQTRDWHDRLLEQRNEIEHKITTHEKWLRDKAGRIQADVELLREILVELGAMRYEAGVDPTGMRGG